MRLLRPRSLQLRLAVRLGALLFLATILAAGTFFYLSSRTADALSSRDLFRQADLLASSLGNDRFFRPIAQLTESGLLDEDTLFAIRDREGRVMAASNDAMRRIAENRPPAGRRPEFFHLDAFGSPPRDYDGIDVSEGSPIGPVTVTVAEPAEAEDQLLNLMLRDIARQAAWIIPLFVAATLLVGIYAIRGGLRPLRETAQQAATIKPDAMSVRLSTENLPSEVSPFVNTVNRALDRLEKGFALQRQFTANAAHELRTPLAIITGALEGINGDETFVKLKQDVARMNRLVDQLLHVARLDSVALDIDTDVDLRTCAKEVVEYIAPLAIEQGRSIALAGADLPVMVRGNAHAIEDAVRNLAENAIMHTPPDTEVLIEVSDGGSVSVTDQGPGVREEDKGHIFDRFWRDPGASGDGAGLGLAIVKEIMKMHDGSVEVADNPDGGACFILRFRPAPPGNRDT